MKKKFSTFFMACMFLLGTVSAFAQPKAVSKLVKGDNEGLYQLAVGSSAGDEVLAIDNNGIVKVVDLSSNDLTNLKINLSHTLWCVHVSHVKQGVPPTYEFLNKATGQYLSVSMQGLGKKNENLNSVLIPDQVESNGEIYNWSFSNSYATNNSLQPATLTSFYEDDYVVGFVVNGGEVGVKKMYEKDIVDGITSNYYETFTLQEAQSVVLSELDFNSVLAFQDKEDGVELEFDPVIKNNPFLSHGKLFAEKSVTTDYLYIRDENANYLMVDTSYINTIGTDYLGYKWVDLSKKSNPVAFLDNTDDFGGQYRFKFTYNPSKNDLEIQVFQSTYKSSGAKNWISWDGNSQNTYTPVWGRCIRVQDYGTEGYVLTVSSENAQGTDLDQNVKVGFVDFKGCAASNNKTSLDEDLYVIINEEGKYLAVPLSQDVHNHDFGGRYAEWVTLDRNKDAWRMPAFQWVVEKTQSVSELASTSPVKITNREYSSVVLENGRVQLYKNDSTKIEGVKITSANFIQDSANVKADPYVGYRMLDKDSLKVTGYKFRYLHEYNDEKYLGIGGFENDSVLYADEKSQFALDTVPVNHLQSAYTSQYENSTERYETQTYGYTPMKNAKEAKKGWAQLHRRSYYITVKGTAEPTYVVKDAEDRYAVSSKIDYDNIPVRFYLKENNYKEEVDRDYYVLIDQTTDDHDPNNASFESRKAAIDDNTVIAKSYALTENRTSAFAIEIDDTPLYRRFANDPAQGAYANGDGPDTMRFYEKYRHEYLQMEANPNFMEAGIDFLGINAKSEAKGGLAFQVDSAWIGRGLGYIKPQYLISIDRNDQPAVAPIECPEEFHGNAPDGTPYDKWTCPHATKGTPGFNRGRYLINFEFQGYGAASTATEKEIAENKYMWKKFYRAGFVDAVHVGDSLYILRDDFAGITNAHIDTAKIKAAEAAWRKADKKVDRSKLSYYIIDLSGDKHTFATWSMRYIEPENVATNNAFLMESMSWNNGNERNWIAPTYGAWLKMQNGCLVLSDRYDSEFRKETAGDDALIFNVEYVDGDELATDDEVIAESSVVVIAGQGTVTVKNAAGKKVAISNILGQTVANTVVTSDNATIAVPTGVVVVAVEGESAVKAIVK